MSTIARVNCYEIVHPTKYVLPIWSAEELDLTSRASLMFSWRMKMHVLKPLGMTEIRFVKLVTSGLLVLTLVSGSTKYLTGSKGAKERSTESDFHSYNLKNRLSFPCWNLYKCCCSMCKLIWKQLQASNEEHLWWGMLPAINLSSWFLSLILLKGKQFGPVRESNPGPLTPEARIMPLDQQAKGDWTSFDKVVNVPPLVEPNIFFSYDTITCCPTVASSENFELGKFAPIATAHL